MAPDDLKINRGKWYFLDTPSSQYVYGALTAAYLPKNLSFTTYWKDYRIGYIAPSDIAAGQHRFWWTGQIDMRAKITS